MAMKKNLSFFIAFTMIFSFSIFSNTVSAKEKNMNKIEVKKEGGNTYFDTVQEAINSVLDGESAEIFVPEGTYNENIKISNFINSKKVNRTIVLKGQQSGNDAVVNGQARKNNETILTGGVEVNGLEGNHSITIDGFTIKNNGILATGWGQLLSTTGKFEVINNVIVDINDNSTKSAIHINANAEQEKVSTYRFENNYIDNVGSVDADGKANDKNGVYVATTTDNMIFSNNVVQNVNHSILQISACRVNDKLTIKNNIIKNWNVDGKAGNGSVISQGDGWYLPKSSPNMSLYANENSITRDKNLPGAQGSSSRVASPGKVKDISNNYWGTNDITSSVISGMSSAKVSPFYTDESMSKPLEQYLSTINFSCSDLSLNNASTFERKLNPSKTVLGKQDEKVVTFDWSVKDSSVISLEDRSGSMYAIGKKLGETSITLSATDPISKNVFTITKDVKVINDLKGLRIEDVYVVPNGQIQLEILPTPEGAIIPSTYTYEFLSDDENIATVDKDGLVTAKGIEGEVNISVKAKLYSTVKYTVNAKVIVTKNIPITKIDMINKLSLIVGESSVMEVKIFPINTTQDKKITWDSSDESIVKVDKDGKVTAIHHGKAIITAKVGTISSTCEVTVTPKMLELNHIPTISAGDKVLKVGQYYDVLNGITANDKEDGDLTKSIKVIKNTVDILKVGTYEVIYQVTDNNRAICTKAIKVVVQENPISEGVNDPSNKNDKVVSTGDYTFTIMWIGLLAISTKVLFVYYLKKKQNN